MEIETGRGKKARRAYGFDDIAIVPSRRTRDPDDVDVSWKLGDYRFEPPLLPSAMGGGGPPRPDGTPRGSPGPAAASFRSSPPRWTGSSRRARPASSAASAASRS